MNLRRSLLGEIMAEERENPEALDNIELKIDAQTAKACLNALTALVEETRVQLRPDGIFVKVVDISNVALVSLSLKEDAFEEYHVPAETLVALDLMSLKPLIKASDVVEVSFDVDKIRIHSGNMEFSTILIDPDSVKKEPEVSLDFNENLAVNTTNFRHALKMIKEISEVVVLECEESELRVRGKSDISELSFGLPVECNDMSAKSHYSIEYLHNIMKGVTGSDMEIAFRSDYPLMIRTEIADGSGKLEYLLAPRIAEDDF